MKLTIIVVDNFVAIDGIGHYFDLSGFNLANIHAVQFNNGAGEIERTDGSAPTYIGDVNNFQAVIDAYSAHVLSLVPPPPTAAQLALQKIAAINRTAEQSVSTITDQYPQFEIDTFDAQEREARAWLLNNATATPTLSIIAQGRGITLADLVGRVITKADQFRPFVASIIAQRQALEDQLNAVDLAGVNAASQIAAVVWPS